MPVISGGKFVIVGGASQIGSHIGQQLLAADAREVILLDNLSLGSAEPLQPLLEDPRCTFVRGDVMRLTDLYEPLANADGVFAVAGIMPKTMAEDPWAGLDVNIRGVQNTLEACRYRGVKKVVLSSATGVYGATLDDPTTEDAPMRWQVMAPQTVLYVASKVIGETLAQMQRQRHGLDYVALRYSAVYGPRQHGRAMLGGHLADSCLRVRRGEPPIVDGNGHQVQDYVYVGDAARANLMAMESAVTGEAINICTGLDTTQARVVELVLQASGSSLQPAYRPTAAAPPWYALKVGLSREKAKRLLDWEPEVSIEQGIENVLRWVDKERALAG